MNEVIKVDKAELDAQIKRLRQLKNSTELKDAVDKLKNIFVNSLGKTSVTSNGYFASFMGLYNNMDTLFKTTLEFLENKHGDYVKADS